MKEVRRIQVYQDNDGKWIFENRIVYFKEEDPRIPQVGKTLYSDFCEFFMFVDKDDDIYESYKKLRSLSLDCLKKRKENALKTAEREEEREKFLSLTVIPRDVLTSEE